MGIVDEFLKLEAFLDDIESDEKILNTLKNKSIANGVYDDFYDYLFKDEFFNNNEKEEENDDENEDDEDNDDDENDEDEKYDYYEENEDDENQYQLECIETKENPTPEEIKFYLTHYEDYRPTYSQFLVTNYPHDDWPKKRTHGNWLNSFFVRNFKKHPERAFEIWNAILDEFPPELTLSNAGEITEELVLLSCAHAPLELIKNLKDDVFFEKLYGKNIDYDFGYSLSKLLLISMENDEMDLLEKLSDRAKTLLNDESKKHSKDSYRSYLELFANLFNLPTEICNNDEAIRCVFNVFMK